ncbi:uncharacterized protein A1O9_00997 [Exophiala aquamarina CBS 119918]|uniref:DNA polymerase eta n=1 Tax=Exophiala aquamarina CBS 119918 TaxID=1182545 RepID=A0A072PTD6_9EURO|nr:uncharacterized protein A1O9_00997 [Exophiala aquamarina CBS 119918]KEF63022.1 hypothetical protein A1O9_00997 [Exophiala aquamarina CBS 119918]
MGPNDIPCKSQFTRRDLHLLSQSSTKSPLRVIALIDFDCFYAQCEGVRLGLPADQPLGVQQFLHVIAINYPARAAGLKKVVTAVEAREKCPNIVLQHVPTWREGDTNWRYRDDVLQHMATDKSSLDYYRLQSRKAIELVKEALPTASRRIEKAGIDEVFIDLSGPVYDVLVQRFPDLLACESDLPNPSNIVLDWEDDQLVPCEPEVESKRNHEALDWHIIALNVGSEIVRDIRRKIMSGLNYTSSAGIAHNKVLAKLAAGHNKPNKQTIVRKCSTSSFLSGYKITKLRGLGGKLGRQVVTIYGLETISDLLQFPLKEMQSKLGSQSGKWVYQAIRGLEDSEVVQRTEIKSMLSAKTFSPSIAGPQQAERWLRIFAADIVGRLEDEEGRRPTTVAVHHHIRGRFGPTRSKQTPIPAGTNIDAECLYKLSKELLGKISEEGPSWPCLTLSVGVSHFRDTGKSSQLISGFTVPLSAKPSSDRPLQTISSSLKRSSDEPLPDERSKKPTILDFHGFSHSPTKSARASSSRDGSGVQTSSDNITSSQHRLRSAKEQVDREPSELNSLDKEGIYRCPHCSEEVPAQTVLEHLDWHVALDLHDQT